MLLAAHTAASARFEEQDVAACGRPATARGRAVRIELRERFVDPLGRNGSLSGGKRGASRPGASIM